MMMIMGSSFRVVSTTHDSELRAMCVCERGRLERRRLGIERRVSSTKAVLAEIFCSTTNVLVRGARCIDSNVEAQDQVWMIYGKHQANDL
jgi:hypothetical protein